MTVWLGELKAFYRVGREMARSIEPGERGLAERVLCGARPRF